MSAPTSALHRQPRVLGLVAVGGTVGTGLRYVVTRLGSQLTSVPVTTVLINLAGAFCLGLLLEALARRRPDEATLRLLLGIGLLGGFTTYSSLAVDVTALGGHGRWLAAVGVAAATVMGGALTAALGIALAARRHRRPAPG